jgi:hypothetical protein
VGAAAGANGGPEFNHNAFLSRLQHVTTTPSSREECSQVTQSHCTGGSVVEWVGMLITAARLSFSVQSGKVATTFPGLAPYLRSPTVLAVNDPTNSSTLSKVEDCPAQRRRSIRRTTMISFFPPDLFQASLHILLVSDFCPGGVQVHSFPSSVPYALLCSTLPSRSGSFKIPSTKSTVLLAHYFEVDAMTFDD